MRITRIVALAIIAGTIAVQGGMLGAQAQTLRAAGPPSEFPPGSFKGNQYVDSRGCIYIRAGVDGNVTWVPRVTRSRKQLCGYKPTPVAGATARQTQSGPAPELITLPQDQRPTSAASVPPAKTATRPAVVTSAKPRRTAQSTSANPSRVTISKPRRVVQPAPVAPAPKPVVAPQPPVTAGGCSGASALSQQYINTGPRVRCGPQSEPPVTYGRGGGHDRNSSLNLAPDTRLLPAHVYGDRRLSAGLEVPEGYRQVWDDDRLNPRRGERTMAAAILSPHSTVPTGYILVERDDDRMNAMRGHRTSEGDAQMAEIWTNTIPRTLVRKPLDRPTVRLSGSAARSAAEARDPLILRLSTRSDPNAAAQITESAPRRYVRAATFADPEAARTAAYALAERTGLPVRLGTLSRDGATYKVVLAGPFSAMQEGQEALFQVRSAGYPKARLSK